MNPAKALALTLEFEATIDSVTAEDIVKRTKELMDDDSTTLGNATEQSGDPSVASSDDIESSLDDSDSLGGLGPGSNQMRLSDGKLIYVHDYIGREYSTMIKRIHAPVNTVPFPELPGQKVVLHDYQKVGVTILSRMCDGPFRGGILADSTGLGKTITAVAFLQHRKGTSVAGAFDMIVCHQNLIDQWEREIARFQDKEYAPKVLKVNADVKDGAMRLSCNREFNVLLVSFDRVFHDWKRRSQFNESVEQIVMEQDPSKRSDKFRHLVRPALDFHSELFKLDKRNMIRHLIIDESHFIKDRMGHIHAALLDLPAQFIIQLTGTPFPNKWHDIFGLIDVQHSQPFGKFEDFMHVFGQPHFLPEGQWQDPDTHQFENLIKFLQPFILARPITTLSLPDLKHKTTSYSLEYDETSRVTQLLHCFLKEIGRLLSLGEDDIASQNFERAIIMATRAQQISSHPWLSKAITSEGRLVNQGGTITTDSLSERAQKLFNNIIRPLSVEAPSVVQDGEPQAHSRMTKIVSFVMRMNPETNASQVAPVMMSNSYSCPRLDELLHPNEELLSKTEGHGRVLWRNKLHSCAIEELNRGRVKALVDTYQAIQQQFPDGKVIFCSIFLQLLDILEAVLRRKHNVFSFRFDGTIAAGASRDAQLQSFSICPDPARPLLVTSDDGYVGLNQIAASHVVLAEPCWTTALERQAIARVHRQGQQQHITVWHVTCKNSSFEVYMQQTRNAKRVFSDKVMQRLVRPDSEKIIIPRIWPVFLFT